MSSKFESCPKLREFQIPSFPKARDFQIRNSSEFHVLYTLPSSELRAFHPQQFQNHSKTAFAARRELNLLAAQPRTVPHLFHVNTAQNPQQIPHFSRPQFHRSPFIPLIVKKLAFAASVQQSVRLIDSIPVHQCIFVCPRIVF